MPIRFTFTEGTYAPLFICDACHKKITHDGNVHYDTNNNTSPNTPIRFSHNGVCAITVDEIYFSEPHYPGATCLDEFLYFLSYNSKIKPITDKEYKDHPY